MPYTLQVHSHFTLHLYTPALSLTHTCAHTQQKSRRRKVIAMDALEAQLLQLRHENLGLRQLIRTALPDRAEAILIECCGGAAGAVPPAMGCVPVSESTASSVSHRASKQCPDALAAQQQQRRGKLDGSGSGAMYKSHTYKSCAGELRAGVPNALQLMEQDYQMIKSLKNSQQNFVLTNPSLPDNPIVYASAGFLAHSGYTAAEIVGKNMRVMQVRLSLVHM
jgi:hypothetical protein